MCKELEDELAIGRKAAADLVAHVERMGASELTLPVMGEDLAYWKVTALCVGGILSPQEEK
jgi:hypothetical protein